jgi:C4-dicarboxylate-specific signal transduction histidine kinase
VVEQARLGQELRYEHRLQMPDGTIKYVYMQAHPTRDEQGRLEYIGAIRDVTEHQHSEEALNRLRAELAHVTRANSLCALTASIAHEINQPLAGIMTNASTGLRMLSATPPNVDGALQTVKRTLRDGRRASDVVTHLRALFSKKMVSNERVDLNEAACEVVELLRSAMRRDRIVLQHDWADDLPSVTGDRVQLQQVVLNLLLNAIEAMRDVEGRPRQLLIQTRREAGDEVLLSVADAGSGFDPQHAENLFESFYTTKGEGMGLGLSVSRSIIDIHGGRIWASSNAGPGATFSFSIPCQTGGTTACDRSDISSLSTVAVTPGIGGA